MRGLGTNKTGYTATAVARKIVRGEATPNGPLTMDAADATSTTSMDLVKVSLEEQG